MKYFIFDDLFKVNIVKILEPKIIKNAWRMINDIIALPVAHIFVGKVNYLKLFLKHSVIHKF
jgi:hypothetical protein